MQKTKAVTLVNLLFDCGPLNIVDIENGHFNYSLIYLLVFTMTFNVIYFIYFFFFIKISTYTCINVDNI